MTCHFSGVAGIVVPESAGSNGTDDRLSVRIGLTSGEPLEEAGDLFGSVVNLASRLCDLADSGEILLSEECRGELNNESIELESIGEVTIRGFDEPVSVSRVAE